MCEAKTSENAKGGGVGGEKLLLRRDDSGELAIPTPFTDVSMANIDIFHSTTATIVFRPQ